MTAPRMVIRAGNGTLRVDPPDEGNLRLAIGWGPETRQRLREHLRKARDDALADGDRLFATDVQAWLRMLDEADSADPPPPVYPGRRYPKVQVRR